MFTNRMSLFDDNIAKIMYQMFDKDFFRCYFSKPSTNGFTKYVVAPMLGVKPEDIDQISYSAKGNEYISLYRNFNIILIKLKDGQCKEPTFADIVIDVESNYKAYKTKDMTLFIFEHNDLCSESMTLDKMHKYIYKLLDYMKPLESEYRPINLFGKFLSIDEYVNRATDYQIYMIFYNKSNKNIPNVEKFIEDSFDNSEWLKNRYDSANDYIDNMEQLQVKFLNSALR